MHFEGTVTINAPRDEVWQFLTDPDRVGKCVPGLESLEIITPDQKFRAVAAVGFGSVKARFRTDIEWTELEPPRRAKMKAHGTAPGSSIDSLSEMVLTDGPDGSTEMRWSADITVLGRIASTAARLMGGVTQKVTSAFFECVRKRVEA
jgi:carbon monoxide dehydrogenase subunit G